MRILHYLYGLNIGGVETTLMNLLPLLDPNEFQIDFCIQNRNVTNISLKEMIDKRGGKIFLLPAFFKHPLGHKRQLGELLKSGYDCIHIHANALLNTIPIIEAHLNNINIVLHSRNTQNNEGGIIGKYLHYYNRFKIRNIPYKCLACGPEAGNWMHGKKVFEIIDNGVDSKAFVFSQKKLDELKNILGIRNRIIGHVGRFVEAKNHVFILELFSRYLELHDDVSLVLVGDGPLLGKMKEYAAKLGISEQVYFLGSRNDVKSLLGIFDAFIFPSKFEGLPNAVVEAQASGLRIVTSAIVTRSVDVTGNIRFLDLNASLEDWISAIDWLLQDYDRGAARRKIVNTKFDINLSADKLRMIYRQFKKDDRQC